MPALLPCRPLCHAAMCPTAAPDGTVLVVRFKHGRQGEYSKASQKDSGRKVYIKILAGQIRQIEARTARKHLKTVTFGWFLNVAT